MYVCIRVFTIIYYWVLGCFILLFVMYFITFDSLFLFSFDHTFCLYVWTFGRLIVCVFEYLKLAGVSNVLISFFYVFVNMYVWLHVPLFSITFYIPVLSVSLLT